MRRGNLGLAPTRRRPGDPMARYDHLPPDLRRWMAQAALPWSPTSCLRIWRKVIARGGTEAEARAALDAAEARRLGGVRAASPHSAEPARRRIG